MSTQLWKLEQKETKIIHFMEKEAEAPPPEDKWLTEMYTLGGKANTNIQVS